EKQLADRVGAKTTREKCPTGRPESIISSPNPATGRRDIYAALSGSAARRDRERGDSAGSDVLCSTEGQDSRSDRLARTNQVPLSGRARRVNSSATSLHMFERGYRVQSCFRWHVF